MLIGLINNQLEVVKCVLNSDVIFKAFAKVIEALQTKNFTTVKNTIKAVYPSLTDECKKCLGVE